MIADLINLAVFSPESILAEFFSATPTVIYVMVFSLMVIESSFIPFPSEVIVPPAAYLASTTHTVNVIIITFLATLGAIVGAMVNYYLSVWIGRPLVYKFADSKIGHACLIDRRKVDKAEDYFDRHGAISTFIGRLIPAVRQLISIPAGLAKMNIVKFILFTGLGALTWNIILSSLGWWLGKAVPKDKLFDKVEQYNDYLTYAGILLGIICLGIILYNTFYYKKKKDNL